MPVGGRLGVALVLAGAMLWPSPGRAQPGFYVTPSLSVGEVYDDNLFSTVKNRQHDYFSRFTPGFQAGYQSVPLTLLGRYSFDAELYNEHPELTTSRARQEIAGQLISRPDPLLTLSLDGTYTETETPTDLNVGTGLAGARLGARRLLLSPSVAYRFDPLTEGVVDYTYQTDAQARSPGTVTNIGDVRLDRRLTPQDTGTLGYTFRRFRFELLGTVISHSLTLGWEHRFTPQTTVTLRGGSRLSEGAVDPDVQASIRQRLRLGEASFTYARSQATVIGRGGTVDVESFVMGATYTPLQFLQLSAAPAVYRASSGGAEATVYQLSLDATYRIRRWLSVGGAYWFQLQQGGVDLTTPPKQEILRNTILLKLTIESPYRVY